MITKTIFMAVAMLTMLVPLAGMTPTDAQVSDDNTYQKLLALFEKGQSIQDKIQELETLQSQTRDSKEIAAYQKQIDLLQQKAAKIDQKINELAPITEKVEGTMSASVAQGGASTSSSGGPHTIVSQSANGCNGQSQSYFATMSVNPITDTSYWNIAYTDPISIGFWPACFHTGWLTYEIIIQNHSAGWTCAANNITGASSSFAQTCTGKNMSAGDLVKVSTIAHYAQWQISHAKYVVI